MNSRFPALAVLFAAFPLTVSNAQASSAHLTPRASAEAQLGRVKASPFDGLRWSEDQPEVKVGDTWYRPIRIDGVSVESILAFCDKRWPGKRTKRFGEDLVEAMTLMEHEVGKTVSLELVKLEDGSDVKLDAVEMTLAKRQAILAAARGVAPDRSARPRTPKTVPRDVALQDIEVFGTRLKMQFAYLELSGVDLDQELKAIAGSTASEVRVEALASQLHRLLMRFGDGHARVEAPRPGSPGLHLPFLLDAAEGGVVALDPGRRRFVDRKHPYVQAVDGQSMDEWIEAMSTLVVAGSPQLVRHRSLRAMREIERVREVLGRAGSESVTLTLSSKPKGGRKKDVTLGLKARRPTYGSWPRTGTRLLEAEDAGRAKGGIGVIRLPRMDDDLIPEVRAAMEDFRGTAGLIIDVRGNGGGLRGLCAALAGYLVDEETGPVVGNVAAYRLAPQFREDHLGGSRLLYRESDSIWSDAQRSAIQEFTGTFRPEWSLPEGFSEWHYLVLDRTGHPDEFHYEGPVVVLADEACFSATDIFVAALGALPNVTLLGTATGGGSARSQGFELPGTGIEVRCASMASFQPNGLLYDGNGVAVDIEVERAPGDLLLGGGDAQLEAAVRHLNRR